MPMLNVLEMSRLYRDEWVVLDYLLRVVDHGTSLRMLRAKYAAVRSRHTFYFVPG